ncbi:MAG: 50S ribosomal protein L11 methyltransferase [Alphaproteobacteria bacterium]|nr:50S ribosomal protein L11 methyltransferase [Alphaproteobacteria bacterium]
MTAQQPEPLWLIELDVPSTGIDIFQGLLDPFAEAVSIFEAENGALWRISGYSAGEPERAPIEAAAAVAACAAGLSVPELRIEALAEKDWLAENRRSFAPVSAARFFVHGSNFDGVPPAGSIPIMLNAGPAFGAGSHETTRGCLIAFDGLARRRNFAPKRILDIGCGSGILAIAMAKLWDRPVRAIDHDPLAVQTTKENASANAVGELVEATGGDGLNPNLLRCHQPYDLVAANILSQPLIDFAPRLAVALAPEGFTVLSGILREQQNEVRAAYRQAGFIAAGSVPLGEWRTLIYRRDMPPENRVARIT